LNEYFENTIKKLKQSPDIIGFQTRYHFMQPRSELNSPPFRFQNNAIPRPSAPNPHPSNLVEGVPFSVDLTGLLKSGEKAGLAARITSPGGNWAWQDDTATKWGNANVPLSRGFSGITGPVKLVVTDPVYVDDIYVRNTPHPRDHPIRPCLRGSNSLLVGKDKSFRRLPVHTSLPLGWPYQAVVVRGKGRYGLRLTREELVAGCWQINSFRFWQRGGDHSSRRGESCFFNLGRMPASERSVPTS